MTRTLTLVFLFITSIALKADEPIRIEIGKNYSGYSNEELRRRVWQLERAVAQLQDQVFQLAVRNETQIRNGGQWTCSIQSFGKTHVSSGISRASALAQTLKKCGDATNPIHCKESDINCSNE